ncbi:MAG: 4Fe-4S dicluster domain-containing protein [Bilophila wadsworthia]
MDELTQLANALMALDDKLAACMKCGFCQAFCPMYMTTRIEGDLTRGKIALVENLAHRIIEDPEAVNEKLSRCLLCGSCQANCPSGVKTTDIFLEARAIVANLSGALGHQEGAFRMLLPIRGCSARCCVSARSRTSSSRTRPPQTRFAHRC